MRHRHHEADNRPFPLHPVRGSRTGVVANLKPHEQSSARPIDSAIPQEGDLASLREHLETVARAFPGLLLKTFQRSSKILNETNCMCTAKRIGSPSAPLSPQRVPWDRRET